MNTDIPITMCSDCNKPMVNYDLHEFTCRRTNITISLEEKLCLSCSSKVMNVVDIAFEDMYSSIGRLESLAMSFDDEETHQKKLDPSFVYKLVLQHYRNFLQDVCFKKTGNLFYPGFDYDLWESILGINNKIRISNKCIYYIKSYVKSTGLWFSCPTSSTVLNENVYPFIKVEDWVELYNARRRTKLNEQSTLRRTEKND